MSKWLKVLRIEANMTQYELAAKVGVTHVTICNIERGKMRPSVSLAKKLGDALSFDWTKFYDDVSKNRKIVVIRESEV